MKTLTAVTAVLLTIVTTAPAVTVDFETAVGGPTIVDGDVTFYSIDGSDLTLQPTPNNTQGVIDSSPYSPIRADIAGGALSVSVDLGDFASDDDNLFLRAYDNNDVLIDQDSDFIDSSFTGMVTLDVADPDIAYVIFGGVGLIGESNVYADNFTYRPVPEPASLTLLGLGAAALLRRRR